MHIKDYMILLFIIYYLLGIGYYLSLILDIQIVNEEILITYYLLVLITLQYKDSYE